MFGLLLVYDDGQFSVLSHVKSDAKSYATTRYKLIKISIIQNKIAWVSGRYFLIWGKKKLFYKISAFFLEYFLIFFLRNFF